MRSCLLSLQGGTHCPWPGTLQSSPPPSVFLELPDELVRSWAERPYSCRSTIPVNFPLGNGQVGLAMSPLMRSLVVAHLHPRAMVMPFRSPSLASKPDRLQSALTEEAYKASAFAIREVNALSLPTRRCETKFLPLHPALHSACWGKGYEHPCSLGAHWVA